MSRKSKTRLSKSKQEMNEINKGEIILDSKPVVPEVQPQVQIAQMQHQSLGRWFGVMIKKIAVVIQKLKKMCFYQ